MRKLKKRMADFLLQRYKQRKTRSSVHTSEHALSVVRHMLQKAKYGFLITRGESDRCSARLVEPIIDQQNDFVLWLGTNPSLRKVQEIKKNPSATMAIEDPKEQANLILYGLASIVIDPALRRKYWRSHWKLFFPSGPESPEFLLIRFEAQRIELMSFRRNVIPEPFGLKPLVLIKHSQGWEIEKSYS